MARTDNQENKYSCAIRKKKIRRVITSKINFAFGMQIKCTKLCNYVEKIKIQRHQTDLYSTQINQQPSVSQLLQLGNYIIDK